MQRFLLIVMIATLPAIAFMMYTHATILYIPGIKEPLPLVTFNQKTPLRVTVVDSAEKLQRGLSGKKSLAPTEGMLFIFPDNDFHGIWMKEMNFPIDILWIDQRGIVVDAKENVRPDTFPKVFEPRIPARFVLETNSYFLDSFDIRVGDHVTIPQDILPEDLRTK